jgi:precorrin-3B synthase
VPTPLIRRGDADACPGALRLHAAADGPLARVRLPGGRLTGGQLSAIRELAEAFGDGHIELTSRGNLQLRALTSAPADMLAARLAAAGLLPSRTHELVRNITASPLAPPESAGRVDVRRLISELDRALCADPRLASLPGRFLFALDSGGWDVAPSADVAAVPAAALAGSPLADAPRSARLVPSSHRPPAHVPGDGSVIGRTQPAEPVLRAGDQVRSTGTAEIAILFAGVDAGLRVPAVDVVGALLTAAHAFLDERAAQLSADQANPARAAWRVRELVDGAVRVAVRTAAALGVDLGVGGPVPGPGGREPVGIIGQPGGLVALSAVVPLGRVSGVQMKVLEKAEAIVVTPWRGVVLPDLPSSAAEPWQRALADVGLEVRSGSRWSGVTACAGRPGCAKSLADVRRDAAVAASSSDCDEGSLPVHWVGCARGCGSPAGPHVRAEATGSGYQVRADGFSGFASADEAGGLVAAAREG